MSVNKIHQLSKYKFSKRVMSCWYCYCPYCHEEMSKDQKYNITMGTCGHIMHTSCLLKRLSKKEIPEYCCDHQIVGSYNVAVTECGHKMHTSCLVKNRCLHKSNSIFYTESCHYCWSKLAYYSSEERSAYYPMKEGEKQNNRVVDEDK